MESTPRPSAERIQELKQQALEGNIPEGTGSLRQAEENAQRSISELEKMHKMQANQARHRIAIEHRVTSEDVPQLNDRAHLEIYGSQGRKFTNPSTGEVVADREHPYKGLLEKMREEPFSMLGRPKVERDKAAEKRDKEAKKYERELLDLVEKEGFELCQAKLIMDLRAKDKVAKAKLVEKLKTDGATLRDREDNEVTPQQKANERYKHLDGKRLKLIKGEGVFTLDEYKEAKQNGELARYREEDAPTPEPEQPDEPKTPPTPEEPEPKPEKPPTGATEEVQPEDLDKQINDLEQALLQARATTLGVDDYAIPAYRDMEKKLQQLKEERVDYDSDNESGPIMPSSVLGELRKIETERKNLLEKLPELKELAEARKSVLSRKKRKEQNRAKKELKAARNRLRHLKQFENEQIEKLRNIEQAGPDEFDRTGKYIVEEAEIAGEEAPRETSDENEPLHRRDHENTEVRPTDVQDELDAKTAELREAETRTDLKEEELLQAQRERETYILEQLEPMFGQAVNIRDESGNVGDNWRLLGYDGGKFIAVERIDSPGLQREITLEEFFELNKPEEDEEQPS